jgi:hypothetical protein
MYPLEIVCIGYLTLEPAKRNFKDLVIIDHFTKLAITIPTKKQTAKTTATTSLLITKFLQQYILIKEQTFTQRPLKIMFDYMIRTKTLIYHPMNNGITEQFNETLLDILGTLKTSKKADLKSTYQHESKHIISLNMT